MPLLRNEPFVKTPLPDDLEQDEDIFYCSQTEEIFRDYDEFFKRTILLNSLVWSCSVTGKSGLTYEEAVASEQKSKHETDKLPFYAERAVGFLVFFTLRGRIEDLVNDLGNFLKERYFVGEVIECCHAGFKRTATIIEINYDWKIAKNKNQVDWSAFKYVIEIKPNKPENNESSSSENDIKRMAVIQHDAILRKKVAIPKSKCKQFVRNCCEITAADQRYVVKPAVQTELNLEVLRWETFFGGPQPDFEKTPLTRKPYVRSDHPGGQNLGSSSTTPEVQKQPKQPKIEPVEKKEREKSAAELAAEEKRKQTINALMQEAAKLNLTVPDAIHSTDKIFSDFAISGLRDEIRKAKEEEKIRQREERRKARELISDYKKPRDDLECDDHKILPEFLPINLPPGMSDDQFGDCLSIIDFLFAFSEQFQQQQQQMTSSKPDFDGSRPNKLAHCCLDDQYFERLGSNFYSEFLLGRGNGYLELISIFLRMIFEKTFEDDGEDENKDESQSQQQQNQTSTDKDKENLDDSILSAAESTNLFSQQYLDEAKSVYEMVKNTYGVSVRNLPLTERTMTEITRLYFLTCGHCPNLNASKHRVQCRGNYKCWDDYAFSFRVRRQDVIDLLDTKSLLDLSSADRLQVLLALRDQLLTFSAFRNPLQQKLERLNALRTELRQWQTFEQRWEKDSLAAKSATNEEEKPPETAENQPKDEPKTEIKDSSSPSEFLTKVRRYFEGGETKLDKLKQVLQQTDFTKLKGKDEIDEIRRIQKEFLAQEESRTSKEIVQLRASCGLTLLGRDRAYRKYWLIPSYNALLIEQGGDDNFMSETNLHKCDDQLTPLDKVEDKNLTPDQLLVCIGAQNRSRDRPCPVHDGLNGPSWSCVKDHVTLTQLLEALNKRGFREMELYENLRFYENFLTSTCLPFTDVDFFALDNPLESTNGETGRPTNDHVIVAAEMCTRLLDFERNLWTYCLGSVKANSRDQWRNNLHKSLANIQNSDSLRIMLTALRQISDGIDLKNLKAPLNVKNSKDSPTFYAWKQSLANEVHSWSQLFLHLETLDRSIRWRKAAISGHVTSGHSNKSRNIKPKAQTSSSSHNMANGYHEIEPHGSNHDRGSKSRDHTSMHKKWEDTEQQNNVKMSRTGRLVKRPVSFEDLTFEKKGNNHPSSSSGALNSTWHSANNNENPSDSVDQGVSSVKKRRPSSEVSEKCKHLLRLATHFPEAWPFLKPVSKKDAPDYYAIIKTPMDFQTMRERLNSGIYENVDQFLSDLRQIFQNCRTYNDSQTLVYQCGQKLEKYLDNKIAELA